MSIWVEDSMIASLLLVLRSWSHLYLFSGSIIKRHLPQGMSYVFYFFDGGSIRRRVRDNVLNKYRPGPALCVAAYAGILNKSAIIWGE